MTNDDIIDQVLIDECGKDHVQDGAFTCRADDPGGATKFGITVPALTDWWAATGRRAIPGATDIQALTNADARDFYAWLMESSKVAQIHNDCVRWFVFDAVVHMGRAQAVKLLQRALGITDDGVIGPATLAAVPYLNGEKLARLVSVEQMLFYGRLASKNLTDADKDGIPDQLENLGGYLNRLARKMRTIA